MSTGDIVGRSFRIFRQNILLIGKILVLPTILMCLGRIALVVGSTYGVKLVNEASHGIAWFSLSAAGFIVLLAGALLLWLRSLAIIRYLTGFSASYQEAEPIVNSRFWTLVALGIATFMAAVFVMIGWGIVGGFSIPSLKGQGFMPIFGSFGLATALLGLVTSLIFLGLVNNLVGIAIAVEPAQRDLSELISEGFSLTIRSFWRSLWFLIVTWVAVTLVAYPMTLPMVFLIIGYFIAHGTAVGAATEPTLPMYIQVINAVWETVVNMLISPIFYLAYSFYYCDLRIRQEGLDLIQRIDDVEDAEAAGKLSSHGI
ncbi:MAG: hypothetical protein JSS86_01650 [Cyanobacteria bacterium SZAS LIN-2]|nr:hypothetical protein [Cyanobacteria bacterium SZAS LIN-3]MBS1994978.1 hypothetical protein [Cyanobacteria bacterium SZAS LIN-2]